jgi:hypothetical protein
MHLLTIGLLVFCGVVFFHACRQIGRDRRLGRRRERWDHDHGRPTWTRRRRHGR